MTDEAASTKQGLFAPHPEPTTHARGATSLPSHGAGILVRGIAMLMVSQGFTWISAAVITLTLPRYLGSENLGKYSFAVALMGLAGLAANLGIGTYLNREVAREPAAAPRLFTAALATRLMLGIVAAAMLAIAFRFLSSDPVIKLTIYVLAVNVVVDAFAMANVILNGLLRIKWIAVAQALGKLVVAGLVVLALLHGYGPPGVAVASLVGALVSHAVNIVALLRVMRPTLRLDLRLCWELVVRGLPFFVMSAALIVYSQIDTVMLAGLTNNMVVGWYNAAFRIIAIPGFVPVIVMTVTFPALSAAAAELGHFSHIARRAIHVILVALVPIGIGMMLIPNRLTHLLGYPADFSNSWPLIVLLALGLPLIGVDMVIGATLVACERQRQWTMVGIAAAFLNPLVNLLAIPLTEARFGNGAIGAAAVTTLTELFMMVMGLQLLPKGTLDRSTLFESVKVLAVCLPMAIFVWLTRDQPLGLTIGLGGCIYAGSCLLTRVVTLEELLEIRQHLTHRRAESSSVG